MRRQVFFFYLFWAVLILPNCVLAFTEPLCIFGKVTLVLLPVSVYGLLMTCCAKPGKALWLLFPILFLGAFQLVLTYLFGKGVIAVDMWLNLVTTNTGEVEELLSQLAPAIMMVVLIYIPVLAAGVFSIRSTFSLSRNFRSLHRRIALGILPVGGIFLLLSYVVSPFYQIKDDLFPVNVCYNGYLAGKRCKETTRYQDAVRNFRFGAVSTHCDSVPEIVVMVIGETSRAMNWALYGYDRDTNPMLKQLPSLFVYKDEMSQSNTTHKSVPVLLSLAGAENYGDLYKSKGILAAYREAGYHTCFYSNQQRNHSFIDFLGEEADECVFIREEVSPKTEDGLLLDYMKGVLAKEYQRLFVVLHTYGSHFNYQDRYSREEAYFLPDEIKDAEKKYRSALINAYDNSIRETDRFLAELISLLKQEDVCAVMLYTSDHGEDIFDDERNQFLHASPYPTYYQLHVPLLIWTSPVYAALHSLECEQLAAHCDVPTSSHCIFHTLLGIGGLRTPYRNDSLSLASPLFHLSGRYYLDDHNEACRLRDCLDEEDLEWFKIKGLSDE